jgi:hypothetical protein
MVGMIWKNFLNHCFALSYNFRDCKNNKGIYSALDLQSRFNLDELLDISVSHSSGACFTKELTITIKFYPADYSFIKVNLKTISNVLKSI